MTKKYCRIDKDYSVVGRVAEFQANEAEINRVLAFKREVLARLKAQEEAQKEEEKAQ